ncbi:MAG: SDR family oxidoreductase [Pseudomonadota bacterium]
MMRILVTGANGFVGKALCREAVRRGHAVRAAVRSRATADTVAVGDIDGQTDWRAALHGIDVVIHLAARVHVMQESAADPLDAFRSVNVQGTENLARQAAGAGVKRLVYVSSIKVNGGFTCGAGSAERRVLSAEMRKAFREDDVPNPEDAYAISKREAEKTLHRVAAETGLEVVFVRPPLVYGPGVKGNLAQMLHVLTKGIPLPLASVHNLRSLIALDNLVDALLLCATHPAAAGQTYLVSDGEDISTPELLRMLGAATGHPARLFPCPPALLKLAARLTGKSAQIERLLGSLQIDSARIRRELGWLPPLTLQQGLQQAGEHYRNTHP